MIFSVDTAKAFEKIQHSYMIKKKKKKTPERGHKGNINLPKEAKYLSS